MSVEARRDRRRALCAAPQAVAVAAIQDVRAADARVEVFTYPGAGQLFTDPANPDEYDEQAAALLWQRALAFCRAPRG